MALIITMETLITFTIYFVGSLWEYVRKSFHVCFSFWPFTHFSYICIVSFIVVSIFTRLLRFWFTCNYFICIADKFWNVTNPVASSSLLTNVSYSFYLTLSLSGLHTRILYFGCDHVNEFPMSSVINTWVLLHVYSRTIDN